MNKCLYHFNNTLNIIFILLVEFEINESYGIFFGINLYKVCMYFKTVLYSSSSKSVMFPINHTRKRMRYLFVLKYLVNCLILISKVCERCSAGE